MQFKMMKLIKVFVYSKVATKFGFCSNVTSGEVDTYDSSISTDVSQGNV